MQRYALPLVFALSSTACGGMTMALQAPVSSAAPTPIEVKGKIATMGDMSFERTKGGMVSKFSGSAGPWGGEKIKQNFEYSTSDGWAGNCAFASGSQSIAGFDLPSSGGLMCTISKDGSNWTLNLEAVNDGGKRLVGTYSDGTTTVDVRMSREIEGSGFSMFIGYTMASGGGGVAAVQVNGNKALWIVEGAPSPEAIRASVGAYVFSYSAVQQATQ